MSSRLLDVPVLRVDAAAIQQVDLRNVESLRKMWTVFTHCASALEEGRRLENLSWRVWTRETLCCDPIGQTSASKTPVTSSTSTRLVSRIRSDLSESDSSPYPRINCVVRHTTSDDLERMVTTITKKKELGPLPDLTPRNDYIITKENAIPEKAIPETPILPVEKSKASRTNVVRGFSPVRMVRASSSRRFEVTPSSIPTADITAAAPSNNTQPKPKMIFALGASSEDSLEPCLSTRISSREEIEKPCLKKSAMFSFGASSNEDEAHLHENMDGNAPERESTSKAPTQRPTTFQEEVARRTILEEAIVDDVFESDEEDMMDESAIDDEDDSSEWEDSVEGSGNASVDEKNLFQRVDSRVNLTSRRSLITTMLHQQDRMDALLNEATKSKSASAAIPKITMISPKEPPEFSLAEAPQAVAKNVSLISKASQSNAKPIARPGHFSQQLALSPRTTRRNMLASELTVSLRQHLLWERKQKSQNASAALKRRHTTHDVAQLRQFPEASHPTRDETKSSWENYYDGGLGEYNARGW